MTPYPRRISTPIRPLGDRKTRTKNEQKPRDIATGSQTLGNTTEARKLTSLQFSYQLFRLFDGILVSTASQRFGGYVSYLFLSPFRTFPCEKSNTRISRCGLFSPRQLDGRPFEPQTSHCVFWIFPDGIIGASANARKWMESRLIKPRLPGRRTNIISVTIAREYLVVFHTSCTSSYSNGH